MDRLVECVPNFSEGRKTAVVARLCDMIESVGRAWVLDTHSDADHNRSVITFVAEPEVVVEAAVRAARLAVELIDLRQHTGQHPRVGALDVLPFVPVWGVEMAECVALAHEAGGRIWRELGVPVYFYESAARQPERVSLESVRPRGGFELLREEIGVRPERAPDVGERRLHETAGACVVGARPVLVAYNINLRTADVEIARRIARAVRGRDGGLRYLKALGFELPGRGLTQVSMNLVRFEQTSLHHAFAAVKREAEHWGVAVAGSELVGLVPQAALDAAAEFFLQIENYHPESVLENRIAAAFKREHGDAGPSLLADSSAFAGDVSGGGVAAAHAAALGAALGEVVARLIGRKGRQELAREAQDALEELASLRARLAGAAGDDAAAFARVLAARRLSSADEEERRARATIVPLEVARVAVQVGELIEALAELGDPIWLADSAAGAQLALAAVVAARYNVLVNTAGVTDEEFAAEQRARCDELLGRVREIAANVEGMLMETVRQ
ncbi:MAG: glutamate formimidoyltransferase [Acidobacteria bacterium]|nr:glutamate formimidoyltransferase [Acidobacteriota bacterium]